jgi:hypothetical protein
MTFASLILEGDEMIPRVRTTIQIGLMTLALSAGLAAQQSDPSKAATAQDPNQKQSQGNAIGKGDTSANGQNANPGFGRQVPNDSATLSGGQPHSNSTYQKDRNGNQGIDLGWLGIFGLLGLGGLVGRNTRSYQPQHQTEQQMRESRA